MANALIEVDMRVGTVFLYRAPEVQGNSTMVPIKSGQTIEFLDLFQVSMEYKYDPNFSAYVSMLNFHDYQKMVFNTSIKNLLTEKYKSLTVSMKQALPVIVTKTRDLIAVPSLGITQPGFNCKALFRPRFAALSEVSVPKD